MSKQKQRSFQEKALATLIENAYDFLKTALESLEKNTKTSVIDFYTAVELFLKAPLLNEHWSLIVIKNPNFQKFKSGDFTNIDFHESIKRLNEVLEININSETLESFNKVRKHRNQYVHLFIDEDENKLASIALEQSQAWAHLLNLIKNQFAELFKKYPDKNNKIERSLSLNLHFWHEHAKLKLPSIKNLLNQKKKDGATIDLCPTCAICSKVTKEVDLSTFDSSCLICKFYQRLISLKCPDCSKEIRLSEGDKSCICGYLFSPKELYDTLNTYTGRPKDLAIDGLPASCSTCESYELVCKFHDKFLCCNCFEITNTLSKCEYCYTSLNYVNEYSLIVGCSFCDGATG